MAVVRKVAGWELPLILEEYKSYAEPKVRDCDINYITQFQLANVANLGIVKARTRLGVSAFIKTALFTSFVLFIWIFSVMGLETPRRRKQDD